MNQELERKVQERTAVSQIRANQLRELAAELLMAEQREKKKLAHLLHDHLQQLLVAAKMRVSILKHAQKVSIEESANEIAGLLSQSIQCSRELSVELSPPALNESGLTAGLQWLVQWFEQKHAFTVEFTSLPEIRNELPEEIKYFVFSAARELLFNVVKHAKVNTARVKLTYRGGMLYLAVKDRGVGMQTSALEKKGNGFGLFSIKERIELLNGEMKIKGSPGKGMTSVIQIPVTIEEREKSVQASIKNTLKTTLQKSRNIRVLIADDHHLVREGLTAMLAPHKDIEIVAQAFDGENAVKLTSQYVPDVVILDINMPRMSGIDAAKQISCKHPEIHIIGLSTHDSKEVEQAMLEAGASAYCTKDGPPELLISAIREFVTK